MPDRAGQQSMRTELRREAGDRSGVFGPLLTEGLQRLEEFESYAALSAQAKTELEARLHVAPRRQPHRVGAVDGLTDATWLADGEFRLFMKPFSPREITDAVGDMLAAKPVGV